MLVLRLLMFAGIILIIIGAMVGQTYEASTKPAFVQHMMTAGLVCMGLWIGGGILVNIFSKDASDELEQVSRKRDQEGR